MLNQPVNLFWSPLLLASSLILGACGGGGGDNGGTNSGPRQAQNIVYLDDATNSRLMAAFDDGSVTPFSLLTVNGGTIARYSPLLSPDGKHVAFKVIGASTTNLYVSHVNGAYYTQVTALGSNREVSDVAWSPDSSRLVYLADANVNNQYELFMTTAAFDSSTNISASNEIISGTINSSTALDIADPAWSPDGDKVAYLVTDSRRSTRTKTIGLNYHDTSVGNRHSVRISTPSSFPSHQEITDYQWTPDGTRLGYRTNNVDGVYRVFQVGFSGGPPATPEAPLAGYSTTKFAYSADSQTLAMLSYNPTTSVYRLLMEDVNTGTNHFTLSTGATISEMKWANQIPVLAIHGVDPTSNTSYLWIRDLDNGNYTRLNTTTVLGERVSSFDWSPTDDYLGYTSDQGLHLVQPTATPSPVLLHDISNGAMATYKFRWPWSHDGDRLAYSLTNAADSTQSLYVYKLANPNQPVQVAGPVTGKSIASPMWSRDDARLVFRTYQGGCNSELYTTSSTTHNTLLIPGDECQSNVVY